MPPTQDHKVLNGRVAAIVDLLWLGVVAIVDVFPCFEQAMFSSHLVAVARYA